MTGVRSFVGAWCDEDSSPPATPELVVRVLVKRADGSLALETLSQKVLEEHAPALLRLHGVASEANLYLCKLAYEAERNPGAVLAAWPDATGDLVVVTSHEDRLGVRYVPHERSGLAHLFESLTRYIHLTAHDAWKHVAVEGRTVNTAHKWECPRCGAPWGKHGRSGFKKCKSPHKKTEGCSGLVCECKPTSLVYMQSHGETQENPCPTARCCHCGWAGTMPQHRRRNEV